MVNTSLRYIKPESDHLRTKARPLSTLTNDMEGNMSNITEVQTVFEFLEENNTATDEDKAFFAERDHYDNLKAELGYDTVFDAIDGIKPLDYKYFTDDKPLMITYKVIKDMGPTLDDTEWVTFTAVAKDGTLGELWKAGESLFQQAKLFVEDWHIFIEGFDEADDGSLELVTGS